MALTRFKKGKFSFETKAGYGGSIARNLKLEELQQKQKDELSKSEIKLLSGKQALKPKIGSYAKTGMYGFKSPSKTPTTNITTSMGPSLQSSQIFSLSSFIDKKSPTGVLSQKDVGTAFSSFAQQLKTDEEITGVNILKDDASKFTGVNVNKEFQKTYFDYNPKTLMLSGKGWELDIPEEYKKVSDTKYVAPEVEYTKRYKYEVSGKDRDKDRDYGKYNPVEIFLTDKGDKLSKVLKRGVYTKEEDYEREASGDYEREYYKDVYTKELKDYFDTGYLKSKQQWDTYKTRDYELQEGKVRDEDTKREVFKSFDVKYNPEGYKVSQQRWNDFISGGYTQKGKNYRKEKEYRDVMQTEDIIYYDPVTGEPYR
jgi:hypothetical protein